MNTSATPALLRALRDWLDSTVSETGRFDLDPQAMKHRARSLLAGIGEYEGARCKSWGLTSRELAEQLPAWAKAFDLALREAITLRLPFAGLRIFLGPEEGATARRELFADFLGGVLTAYGLKAVRLERREPGGVHEVVPGSPGGASGEDGMGTGSPAVREFVHSMNNRLGGVTAFVSLLRKDPGKTECVQGISDAVDGALELMRVTFPRRPAAGGEKG